MSKVHPFLWFEDKAEEAANYYVAVFKNSNINAVVKYPKAAEAVADRAAGSVMTVDLEIEGEHFTFLNGGKVPGFEFSSAVSFVVSCETQEEVDHYWGKLSAVPEAEQCGWCKDKFGVTWQVVPKILGEMLSDPDQAKVERVTAAFMPMKKLDIASLQQAYDK
ncbi:MAG TPA: VOC family protein [Candidatus Saccharimonadales bacterium]|nr:VOC family protein [Candidatus Saccharimonadales bacterium]